MDKNINQCQNVNHCQNVILEVPYGLFNDFVGVFKGL